jgi:hypothetical protein
MGLGRRTNQSPAHKAFGEPIRDDGSSLLRMSIDSVVDAFWSFGEAPAAAVLAGAVEITSRPLRWP